jgi:uncharacterized protein involved in exopolysaccharide biosynthesis
MKTSTQTFDIVHYVDILNKFKWFIAMAVIIAGLMTGISGLSAPRVYKAKVTFFIFLEQQQQVGAGSYLQNLVPGIFSAPFGSNVTVEALIQSRRMAEGVLNRFYPQQMLSRKTKERGIARIQRMIKVVPFGGGNNSLAIQATAPDPQLAADMANFCVEYLELLNKDLQISTDKRFTKVLDAAVPPIFPESRKIERKVFVAMLATAFLLIVLFFSADYIKYLRQEYKARHS